MAETNNSAKWYVLHTYSGYENKVANSIQTIVELRSLQDLICEVRIPMETVTEIKNGEEVQVERKLFPGYVLINMVVNDDTWILIRGIRGVTGFVGPEGEPTPLTEEEMTSMGISRQEVALPFTQGDNVKIIDGAFKDFIGTVEAVDMAAGKVRVIASMFGRETPVELDLAQVQIIEY